MRRQAHNGGGADYGEGDLYELGDTAERSLENFLDAEAWANGLPTTTVKSFQGAEHCDWQEITFIHWHEADEPVQYVGPGATELRHLLRSTYDAAAALPDDARDTGYRRDGRRLWLGADGTAAYLVNVAGPTDVERCPAAREPILCA